VDRPDDEIPAPGERQRLRWPRSLLRFFGWWFGMFALLGPSSACPFCGQPGCVGGAASAGVFAGMIAAIITAGRWIRHLPRSRASCKEAE
jgi:hypothetical protein